MNDELPLLCTAHEAWQAVLGQLQMEMPRASFDTWVRDTEPLSLENGVLTVAVRNAYARDWLESRLTSTVQRLLIGILDQFTSVQFVVDDSPNEELDCDDEEESEPEVAIEPVQWLDYDKIVQPHKQVVVKGYLRRLGMEIGPKAIWLYIGFHQAAWRAHSNSKESGMALHSQDVMRFSGLSFGAFWRLLRNQRIQSELSGLVQRVDPPNERRYRRGRDKRPHRMPVRYQVCMTPRLTRADSSAVYARLKKLLDKGSSVIEALQELMAAEDVMELLSPIEQPKAVIQFNTVMDMARQEVGKSYTAEIDHLAQELHRRIINSLGDIHITHYFITETIKQFNLTPAQAWLVTVARDMAYLNSRTGERRELVTFKGGYKEMAELIGSKRAKTIQACFNPSWATHQRGGDIRQFMQEQPTAEPRGYEDLRVETMPRTFRVVLDEPLGANGSNKAGASGSNSMGANGSNRQGADGRNSVGANGTNMAGANGTALNSLKHPLKTQRENTHTTEHGEQGAGAAAPSHWELKKLLKQNNVHPKVQRELLAEQTSVQAFVAWVLYTASPEGRWIAEPLGHAISRLREDPLAGPGGAVAQLAGLPPTDLKTLIKLALENPFGIQRAGHPYATVWHEVMGIRTPSLKTVQTILFGQGDHA